MDHYDAWLLNLANEYEESLENTQSDDDEWNAMMPSEEYDD